MPKREPNLPGDIEWQALPKTWQNALSELLQELTALARAARVALEEDRKNR